MITVFSQIHSGVDEYVGAWSRCGGLAQKKMATGRQTSIFTFTAPNIVLVRHQLSQLNSQRQTHLERRLLGQGHKGFNHDPASYFAKVLEAPA